MYDINQVVLRAAAQKDNTVTNYIGVGRTWVTSANQYQGLVASYNKASGGQESAFNLTSSVPGRLLFDFAGSGGDNLCNAITYANNGFITACRSMEANGYYDIYLAKFDNNGVMDSTFGTGGIIKTSLGGDSTKGHAFVRGIVYDSVTGTGGHNGTVVITGAIGKYSPGVFHPFVAAFDQQTGAQYGSTTTLSGINGTAVGIAFDSGNSKYYTASTDTTANHNFYVHQFNTSLAAASSPWGTAVDFTTAISGGAADSVPAAIAVIGTKVFTVGANRVNSSSTWRCAVTSHETSNGNLNTAFGTVNSPLTGGTGNVGITLFTSDVTKDCMLNSLATPPSGTIINTVGTIYNGTNYDYLAAEMDDVGAMVSGFGTNGLQIQAGGSADDVLSFGLYLNGLTSSFYAIGRAQNANYINGAATAKVTTASGAFTSVTNNSWAATTTVGAPSARSGFLSQWTGSTLVVWGGGVNTGGKYDPVADSWTNLATLGALTGRSSTYSAWTGQKFVVWGGTGYPNTGAMYDPSANTWSTMATLGAPSGRKQSSFGNIYSWSPWSGTYIVFWGGYNGSYLNSGGIFDPVNNSWSTMATLNAPSTRDTYDSTWTGTKYLVFGGTGGAALNTGGSYDPATNTWTAMTTLNAPAGRYYVSSAWGSPRWFIWGGNFVVNTGAFYDSTNDSWTTLTTLGAPTPRRSGRGIWTGSKFIVWAGYNGSAYVNTGGIYDYATGSWSSMATTNAPAIRDLPHVYWTGNKMLIWGMESSSVNTGGLYTP